MLQKLKRIFPSLIFYNEVKKTDLTLYKWYITDAQEIVGILKKHLTQDDETLLSIFLTHYNTQFPFTTLQEEKWKKAIQKDQWESNFLDGYYRFVAFTFDKKQMTPTQFKRAICELFDQDIPILWKNESEGMIIEKQNLNNDITSYEEIIDVLMSDLYVNLKFLVGPFRNNEQQIKLNYEYIQIGAEIAFQSIDKNVISFADTIPYLMVHQKHSLELQCLDQFIFQGVEKDDDTFQMIVALINCNLNISEAAKELHLHRNSLQYRLEKLYKNTGLDIKNFRHAMTAYLIFIMEKSYL